MKTMEEKHTYTIEISHDELETIIRGLWAYATRQEEGGVNFVEGLFKENPNITVHELADNPTLNKYAETAAEANNLSREFSKLHGKMWSTDHPDINTIVKKAKDRING